MGFSTGTPSITFVAKSIRLSFKTLLTNGNDFEFKFDIAQNPELNFELGQSDEVVYYTITATAEAKEESH